MRAKRIYINADYIDLVLNKMQKNNITQDYLAEKIGARNNSWVGSFLKKKFKKVDIKYKEILDDFLKSDHDIEAFEAKKKAAFEAKKMLKNKVTEPIKKFMPYTIMPRIWAETSHLLDRWRKEGKY
jgi:hypothetical protein